MTKEEQELREQIARTANEHLESGDATGWFEELYREADGDWDSIPWVDLAPNRFLVEWDKDKINPGEGKSALVVACGLGDEAKYLADRGYNVMAFDISETAIEWAKKVYGDGVAEFLVADMFDAPGDWENGFDLVIEVYTIQALPQDLRDKSIDAISSFVAPGGELVAVQRLRERHSDVPEGPPWAVSKRELERFEENGLSLAEFETFLGDEEEPIVRFVARYVRH